MPHTPSLELLRRRYLCLYPQNLSQLELPAPPILAKNQDFLCSMISDCSIEDAGRPWRKIFVKELVAQIEAGLQEDEEVDARLYDFIIENMSDLPTFAKVSRKYIWGPLTTSGTSITLSEAYAHVSSGTTGLRVWPAAMSMANHIIASPSFVKGNVVLELGCGVGLLSILAAKLGASSVIATDLDQVLIHTRENVRINVCTNAVATQNLDWTSDDTDLPTVDTVIASDIIYDPAIAHPLAHLLRRLLDRMHPDIYLCVCVRNLQTWQAFESAAAEHGLRLDRIQLRTPPNNEGLAMSTEAELSDVILVRIACLR